VGGTDDEAGNDGERGSNESTFHITPDERLVVSGSGGGNRYATTSGESV
jgi:hypothetical protein